MTGLKIMVLQIKKDCNEYKLSRVVLPFIWQAGIKMRNKEHLS